MITGIIDIGTNTFNLLIEDESGRVFYNDKIPVKLGKGGIHKNTIAADAFARGIKLNDDFAQPDNLAALLPAPIDNWLLGVSLLARFTPFAVGAMYTSDAGFFLSVILLGLFLTVRALVRR